MSISGMGPVRYELLMRLPDLRFARLGSIYNILVRTEEETRNKRVSFLSNCLLIKSLKGSVC